MKKRVLAVVCALAIGLLMSFSSVVWASEVEPECDAPPVSISPLNICPPLDGGDCPGTGR